MRGPLGSGSGSGPLSTALVAADGSPIPARVPQPVYEKKEHEYEARNETRRRTAAYLVQREKRVHLHHGEVVTERDEGRDMDDVLRPLPQVGQKLGCPRCSQPDNVTQDDVPPRQVEAAIIDRYRGLPYDDSDETRANQEGERVEEFVHHRVCDVGMRRPNMALHEQRT